MILEKNASPNKIPQLTPQMPPHVEFFDPPMCCPTGLCGPVLDETLLDTSEMIDALQEEGYRVERYQMSSHPQLFLGNPDVMKRVQEKQMAALPIVIVNGNVIAEGYYPKINEIKPYLNGAN